MISLRQHIDNYRTGTERKPVPAVPATPMLRNQPITGDAPALAAFRAALIAMGECGQRAVPSVTTGLSRKLTDITSGLRQAPDRDDLDQASRQVQTELSAWAECALLHHNENEREIKEIMGVVARAADAIGTKDAKYSTEIGSLTGKMRSIADLKDLAAIRSSIIDSAALLKNCVEKMVEEGKASMRHLTAEVEEYRTRLEESEKAAALDPLTKLANRRAFEKQLEVRIVGAKAFSLILIDLNDFKAVNDSYGHVAGDDLLRLFAAELCSQFHASDMVCRWGGDEFAVIVAGGEREAAERVEQVHRWVLGEYKINTGSQTVKAVVNASIGVVQWNNRESGLELVARADQDLYRGKPAASQRTSSRLLPV